MLKTTCSHLSGSRDSVLTVGVCVTYGTIYVHMPRFAGLIGEEFVRCCALTEGCEASLLARVRQSRRGSFSPSPQLAVRWLDANSFLCRHQSTLRRRESGRNTPAEAESIADLRKVRT